MKRTVNLFYLAKPRFGGWPSFTAHLYHSFEEQGFEVRLCKIAERGEWRLRPFGRGLSYQNMDADSAVQLTRAEPTIITAVDKAGVEAASEIVRWSTLVVHDPTEVDALKGLVQLANDVVVIREGNVGMVERARYVPHPYVSHEKRKDVAREWNAVSYSRIDWDKHTDIVLRANQQLEDSNRVRLFGSLNRMYAHHKLDSLVPHWREWYGGEFSPDVPGWELACKARYAVDMSAIKGDGGGTQYTFLEAWDAGAALVVNRAWLQDGGVVEHGTNAFAVGNAEELAERLRAAPGQKVLRAGRERLREHAPAVVVPQYVP